jgi:hypothetical protein
MPEIDIATLERVAQQVFRENKPLPTVAEAFDMEDMLRALQNMRRNMLKMIAGMPPEQINFNPDAETYSLSEIFTHVVSAQGNVYNGFLDTGESNRPHIDPIPRGAGAGAEKGRTAEDVTKELQEATALLVAVVRETYSPAVTRTVTAPNGQTGLTQKSIMLFQLMHDLDHFKQAQTLRRSPTFPKRQPVHATDAALKKTQTMTQEVPSVIDVETDTKPERPE